jgi:hypothetical protein
MDHKLKQMTEILHTIFCRRPHEDDMMKFAHSTKCCYYLEQTIEDSWNQRDHLDWIEQAQFFIALSKPDSLGALDKIVRIYKLAQELQEQNPLFLEYIKSLLNIKEKK